MKPVKKRSCFFGELLKKPLPAFALTGILLALFCVFPAMAQEDWCEGFCVSDPVDQVTYLRHRPEALGFRLGVWDYDMGGSDHIQGIARFNAPDGTPYFFLTTSRDDGAELLIVRMGSRDRDGERLRSNRLLWNEDTDDTPAPASDTVESVYTFTGWKHAGGISVIRHYLVVPLENGKDWNTNPNGERKIGTFAILDIQNPQNPVLLYEHPAWDESQQETKIGVAGITREEDGHYLVLLGVTRGKTSNKLVLFFRSSTTDLETSSFTFVNDQHPDCDGTFATQANSDIVMDTTYQNFNFIRDCDDGSLYLLATFSTSSVPAGGTDKVHFFPVHHDTATDTYAIDDCTRLIESEFSCKTYDSERHCDFIAAAGSYVSPGGELILYATTHYKNTDGGVDEMPMAEFRYRDMAIPASLLWRPHATLPYTQYEADEGDTVTVDGTASRPTFIKGWIDLYEDEDFSDSMITLDWADRMLQNWEVTHEIDGFDDEADSIRFYTPCPSTLTLCTGNHFEETCIDTTCGLGNYASLDAYDVGDDVESVRFNGIAENVLEKAEWDFGTGYTEGGFNGEYTYPDNGDYTVRFRITEQDKDTDVAEAEVKVDNVPPTVSRGALDQPDPEFILPFQTLTFTATFSDPGWLDTHTAVWDFGDGLSGPGTLAEEHAAPDATGSVTATHAYDGTGDYTVTVTVTDDDLGSDTSEAWAVHVADVAEATGILAAYIQDLPPSSFRGNADQQKAAFARMFDAANKQIALERWNGFTTMLHSDIRGKADGQIDGKTANDWITDADAQQHICQKIDDITAYAQTLR